MSSPIQPRTSQNGPVRTRKMRPENAFKTRMLVPVQARTCSNAFKKRSESVWNPVANATK